jgi:hypothetical protein
MNSSSLGKRLFACLALLLAHLAAAHGQTPAGWREFAPAAGGFKVRLPAEPQYLKKPLDWGTVKTEQHLYLAQHGDEAVFMVAYMNIPPGGSTGQNSDLGLEGAIIQVTRGIVGEGGRVLSSGKVARGACEGRELKAATSVNGTPSFMHGQIFRSGLRAYVLIFMSPGSGDEPAARAMNRAFAESFEIADGCNAAVPPARPLPPKTTSTVEGAADASTGWRRFENAERGFAVLLPGPAMFEREQTRGEPDVMFRHGYMHTGERALYVVEVTGDYPPGFFAGRDSFETMLDIALVKARRGLEPHGVEIKHLRDLKAGPHRGREYALVSERLGGTVGRAQVFITPKRIYWFAAVDADPRSRERDLERFFSSIKLEAQ